ncbi:TPA: hypothetical protein ACX3MK_003476 [Raoultella ornithinolytica]
MSANELALKFSTAPAEQLIGVLPVLEVKEALHDEVEVEDEVLNEVWMEHKLEMDATEEVADAFATAMKLALMQPAKTAKATLRKVLKEYPGYGREPPAAS